MKKKEASISYSSGTLCNKNQMILRQPALKLQQCPQAPFRGSAKFHYVNHLFISFHKVFKEPCKTQTYELVHFCLRYH